MVLGGYRRFLVVLRGSRRFSVVLTGSLTVGCLLLLSQLIEQVISIPVSICFKQIVCHEGPSLTPSRIWTTNNIISTATEERSVVCGYN